MYHTASYNYYLTNKLFKCISTLFHILNITNHQYVILPKVASEDLCDWHARVVLHPRTFSPVVLSSALLASGSLAATPSHTGAAAASEGFTSDLDDSTSGGFFWFS